VSISNGVDANSTNFNAAFMSRTINTNTTGSITAGTNFKRAVQDALTAFATGGQSSATAITKDIAVFSTVATAADSGKLPTSSAGLHIIVYNRGSNAMALFPATGDAIDGLSANSSISIPSGDSIAASCRAAGQWITESFQFNLVTVPNGGTGVATLASNGVLLGSGTSAVAVTAAGSADQVLRVPGAGGAPAFGAVDLTKSDAVTGSLPIANGGTGATAASTAFNALSPMTTSGDIIYGGSSGAGTRLAKGTNTQVLTLAAGLPTWATPSAASALPTVQKFTSGSGNYTTPASTRYIRVRMVGAGGGGGGCGTASSGNGAAGGNSTFGTTLLVTNGGGGGPNGNNGPAGGTASLGSGPVGIALTGGGGGGAAATTGTNFVTVGGIGGSSAFGGGGSSGYTGVGGAGAANSGGGGGGAGNQHTSTLISGAGGGAGGFVDAIIVPTASQVFAYVVGAGGAGGTAGTNGFAGGAGAAGQILIEEYY